MAQIIIYCTKRQYKAVAWQVGNPRRWLQHVWSNKARKCIDRAIEEFTVYRPDALSDGEIAIIIDDLTLLNESTSIDAILI